MPRTSFATFLSSIVALSLTVTLHAGPLVYVSNTSQLGTVDLSTGAFQQTGPDFPDPSQGLGFGSNGLLLTIGFDGYLSSIDPITGVMTRIGPSGLSDCSAPTSPCDMNTSVNALTVFDGQALVTDWENRLYRVNQSTGVATSIGLTGIPKVPFIPLSVTDGGLNVYDEALFEADGKLYATFDALRIDLSTDDITTVVNPMLYQINVATGKATSIGSVPFGLGAAIEAGGTTYAFLNATHELATLDLLTGGTTVIGKFDEAAGIVSAAAATPEPGSAGMVAIGLVTLAVWRLRKRHC